MQELIKYFESLEARLSALEDAQQANADKLQANEEKLLAIGERITAMMDILKEAQSKPQPVVVEEPQIPEPVAEPEPVVEPEPEPEPEIESKPEIPEIPEIKEEPKAEPVVEAPKQEVASPNATLYGKAVTDIRQAISLGDRFLYQRELFGQNAELMQRTLTELDALNSFDEAQAYIAQFGWDTESSTYQQFLITLHRRFG